MSDKKSPAESFGEMFKEFGEAVEKIFNDPELKQKAKEFGESAVKSAKTFGDRFKDEEVKNKFKDLGNAAQEFGKSISDYFRDSDREKEETVSGKETSSQEEEPPQKKYEWERKLDQTGKDIGKKMEEAGKKVDNYFRETRGGRLAGYIASIFWSVLFLIFFNYYNQYIAIYHHDNIGGISSWTRYPVLTSDFEKWLPVITIALIASIIGNMLLIFYDKYFFRQAVQLVMDVFSVIASISLLLIFPFNFAASPRLDLTGILNPVITIVLILVSVGIGIGILVRFIKMIVSITKG